MGRLSLQVRARLGDRCPSAIHICSCAPPPASCSTSVLSLSRLLCDMATSVTHRRWWHQRRSWLDVSSQTCSALSFHPALGSGSLPASHLCYILELYPPRRGRKKRGCVCQRIWPEHELRAAPGVPLCRLGRCILKQPTSWIPLNLPKELVRTVGLYFYLVLVQGAWRAV